MKRINIRLEEALQRSESPDPYVLPKIDHERGFFGRNTRRSRDFVEDANTIKAVGVALCIKSPRLGAAIAWRNHPTPVANTTLMKIYYLVRCILWDCRKTAPTGGQLMTNDRQYVMTTKICEEDL